MKRADLTRELGKALEALQWTEKHLAASSEANAALHCNPKVFYSPLTTQVHEAALSLERVIADLDGEDGLADHIARLLAGVVADLDRCEHGRHTADPCFSCRFPGPGNPHLRTGQIIGYGSDASPIYVPAPADRYKPEAWRTRPAVLDESAAPADDFAHPDGEQQANEAHRLVGPVCICGECDRCWESVPGGWLPPAPNCTRHMGADRQLYGRTGPDPAEES